MFIGCRTKRNLIICFLSAFPKTTKLYSQQIIVTARTACGRVYVTVRCPSSVCPSVCLSQLSTTAAACGGFAALGPADRRYRSIAARRTAANAPQQCHVRSRRRRLSKNLLSLFPSVCVYQSILRSFHFICVSHFPLLQAPFSNNEVLNNTLYLVRNNSILSVSMFSLLQFVCFFVYYFWSRVSGIYLSCFGLLCHYSILYCTVLSLVLCGFTNK